MHLGCLSLRFFALLTFPWENLRGEIKKHIKSTEVSKTQTSNIKEKFPFPSEGEAEEKCVCTYLNIGSRNTYVGKETNTFIKNMVVLPDT